VHAESIVKRASTTEARLFRVVSPSSVKSRRYCVEGLRREVQDICGLANPRYGNSKPNGPNMAPPHTDHLPTRES